MSDLTAAASPLALLGLVPGDCIALRSPERSLCRQRRTPCRRSAARPPAFSRGHRPPASLHKHGIVCAQTLQQLRLRFVFVNFIIPYGIIIIIYDFVGSVNYFHYYQYIDYQFIVDRIVDYRRRSSSAFVSLFAFSLWDEVQSAHAAVGLGRSRAGVDEK